VLLTCGDLGRQGLSIGDLDSAWAEQGGVAAVPKGAQRPFLFAKGMQKSNSDS